MSISEDSAEKTSCTRDVVLPIEAATLKLLTLSFFQFATSDCLLSHPPSRDPLPVSASLIAFVLRSPNVSGMLE